MRAAASIQTAYRRLEEAMGYKPEPKATTKRLAELAFVLRRSWGEEAEPIRQAVNWTGRVPARGLSAWQQEALEWLRMDKGE